MSITSKVRQQMKELGLRPSVRDDIASLGVELTICQIIIVGLSLLSVGFLFLPLVFLGKFEVILIFFGVSLVFLIGGMWFWTKRAQLCEQPEDVRD